jgi:hypothetical protein
LYLLNHSIREYLQYLQKMMENQKLQHHARVIQNRTATAAAFIMTVLLLCIEHVRAFANQYHISAHDAMVLASAASSLTRKLSSTYLSGDSIKSKFPKSVSFLGSPSSASNSNSNVGSSTKLCMAWSMPAVAIPNMPSMPTSRDLPLHTLGSWYSEVDPTTKPPVYEEEYDNAYSFSSPTDDWPSSSTEMKESSKTQQNVRRGPIRAIRRVAGRFVEGVTKFPHQY